jgi:glycolate oxidase iron-sulfur subunit
MSEDTAAVIRDSALAATTDVCVKCGLCLPHCPTYLKTSDENESPRGRLSLIQGWAQGALELTPRLAEHVDHCLLCRSCEAACPANVPYGRIIDDFRAHLHEKPSGSGGEGRRINAMVVRFLKTEQPRFIQSGMSRLARSSAGQSLAKQLGLGGLTGGLPDTPAGLRTIKPGQYPQTSKEPQGEAHVFLGCTGTLLDAETLDSAVSLLNTLGIRVDIPEAQGCCGALDLHAGNKQGALEAMQRNAEAFEGPATTPVISCASGCGAMLKDYAKDQGNIGARHSDISSYLERLEWPESLTVAPLEATAVLQSPCSLRNVLKTADAPLKILSKIPGLKVQPLPASIRCCGAAGSFMLNHPDEAQAYRKEILDRMRADPPRYLLSSNPGCSAHLRAGLRELGLEVEVIHPVTLLWRQVQAAQKLAP